MKYVVSCETWWAGKCSHLYVAAHGNYSSRLEDAVAFAATEDAEVEVSRLRQEALAIEADAAVLYRCRIEMII